MAKMRKKDLIEILVSEHNYIEKDIKYKKNVELEFLIENEKSKANETIKVVFEHTQQLGASSHYIYHVKNEGSKVTVQNQGMGDVYFSTEGLANISDKEKRISFRKSKEFRDLDVLYFISASQPVITIIEEK